MEVKASLRKARVGCQKARLVVDMVRGKNVDDAIRILTFAPQKSAVLVKKLVESAYANAEQNKAIDVSRLFIKSISVDMGPSMRRFRPRAQGRATPIKRFTSHINVVLDER